KDVRARVLQRNVKIFRDVVMPRDGLKQTRSDLVGVRIEKAQPLKTGERSQRVEKIRKLHATAEFCIGREILAVACSVLADERDLAHTLRDQVLCFRDDARNGA